MHISDSVRFLTHQPAFRAQPIRVLSRLAFWSVRSRFSKPAHVHIDRWDISLELPPRWRGVSKVVYAFRERCEPELCLLDRYVSHGDIAVDVGASYGLWALALSRLVGPSGKVYAFEPAAEAASVLERNTARNRFGHLSVIRAACANFGGKGGLRHEPDPSRNALELGENRSDETVDVIQLDDAVAKCSLLKIDVEGAEELVLRGAMRLLKQHHPIVVFEVNPEAAIRLGVVPEGAWELLAGLGYHFFRATSDESLTPIETIPSGGNVVGLFQQSSSRVEHPSTAPRAT